MLIYVMFAVKIKDDNRLVSDINIKMYADCDFVPIYRVL